jgi:hypothetical protein
MTIEEGLFLLAIMLSFMLVVAYFNGGDGL